MPHLALVLAMVLAGSVVPIGKYAAELPVFVAACARYGLASLILVPLAWPAWRRMPKLSGADIGLLLAQAAAGSLGFSVCLLLSLRFTGAAEASVVSGALPAVVAICTWMQGERASRLQWAAVALTTVGLAVLNGGGPAASLVGNALAFLAVIGEALFVTLNRRLRTPVPALVVAAAMCLLGFLFTLVPAAAALTQPLPPLASPAWAAVAYHAGVPTVLGFILWYWGAARVSGAEAALSAAVMPAAGVLLSWAVLAEPARGHQLLGLGLILAAIASPVTAPRSCGRRRPAPPAPSRAAAHR